MLKKAVITALAGGILTVANATETPKDTAIAYKKWEIGIMANGFIEGSADDPLQSSAAGGLRAGYRFDPAWSVVGEYMFTSRSSFNYTDNKTDIHRILANINWDTWPKDNYSPYLALGIGYEFFPDFASERNGALVAFGGGVRYIFTETLGINVEAKYKINLDHTDVNVLLSLGLNYRFSTDEDYANK